MARGAGEQSRAASLSQKDARKRASKAASDGDTSSDSDDVDAAVEAQRKKERGLKRIVAAAEEETEALERQLANAEAKKKAKLLMTYWLQQWFPMPIMC